MKDRPKLLFFDITECLNLAVITLGCPTPQICVKECPKKTSVDKKDIKPFCSSDDPDHCPKYILESMDVSNFVQLLIFYEFKKLMLKKRIRILNVLRLSLFLRFFVKIV